MDDKALIERAAEAIFNNRLAPHETKWAALSNSANDEWHRECCRKDARAALSVIEDAVRADERDNCARVAIFFETPPDCSVIEAHGRDMAAIGIAHAIRSRSTPPQPKEDGA